ncbi:MAG: aldo/keto reductase [Clostridiales bacterium]
MEKVKLGKTNLDVTRTAFGALPIQRLNFEEADVILKKAYTNGINFFDTARVYTDSEEKIGYSLSKYRKNIIIATKTNANDEKTLFEHLYCSLENLKTEYIDIYQLHNPLVVPDIKNKLYNALKKAQKEGLIKFIGITCHRLDNAIKAAQSGLYDTVQYPLNTISSDKDLELIDICNNENVGLIAMKAMSGGLILNAKTAFTFLRQFKNVVPIWGIQSIKELDEFLDLDKNPPKLTDEILRTIEKDKKELAGDFCRGCGYCMPCPMKIEIPMAARMSLLLRRAPYENFLSNDWNKKMHLIESCINCGKCKEKCPYDLDTPRLLRDMLLDYKEFYKNHR